MSACPRVNGKMSSKEGATTAKDMSLTLRLFQVAGAS